MCLHVYILRYILIGERNVTQELENGIHVKPNEIERERERERERTRMKYLMEIYMYVNIELSIYSYMHLRLLSFVMYWMWERLVRGRRRRQTERFPRRFFYRNWTTFCYTNIEKWDNVCRREEKRKKRHRLLRLIYAENFSVSLSDQK